jgi:hypothetical protein
MTHVNEENDMNAYITTEYKLNVNELKQIVKDWFEHQMEKQIALQDVTFEVIHSQYCEPELKNAVITIETIENNVEVKQ